VTITAVPSKDRLLDERGFHASYHALPLSKPTSGWPKITGQSSKQSLAADGSKTLFFFRPN
jgi:hypothetical protein